MSSGLTCRQASATKSGKAGEATASATGKVSGGGSNSTKSGAAGGTGKMSPSETGKANGNTTKASATSSAGPVKATTAGAPSLLAQGGGMVTIAGLGVAFAVFM